WCSRSRTANRPRARPSRKPRHRTADAGGRGGARWRTRTPSGSLLSRLCLGGTVGARHHECSPLPRPRQGLRPNSLWEAPMASPGEAPPLKPPSPSEAATLPPAAVVAGPPTIPPPPTGDAVALPPPPAISDSETLAPTGSAAAAGTVASVPGYELL